LMVLVSLVAVGAFDAVGSILVIAFFIIPPASAYLLTDRLALMLIFSAILGSLAAHFGYALARGSLFGVVEIDVLLATLNRWLGLNLAEIWEASISASIVLMMFVLFVVAWLLSPKYGLVSTYWRRIQQRRQFNDQVVLGHIYHHQDTAQAADELTLAGLDRHFRWSTRKMNWVLRRLQSANWVCVVDELVALTPQGVQQVQAFRHDNLIREQADAP
jgi:manganese/zinc/iron transport system permease protein